MGAIVPAAPAGVNVRRYSGRACGLRRRGGPAPLGHERRADLLCEARDLLDKHAAAPAFLPAPLSRCDLQARKAREHRRQRALGVDEEFAPADALELPSEPLENRLARHRLGNLLERQVAVAVALDREAALRAQHDQVDAILADLPLRSDSVAARRELRGHPPLELRPGAGRAFLELV